ncbi:MAG: hypothetical protein HN366_10295 [Deltaproteobacteria bacterium]|jgi:hypothetical protein|nr:hypothetical protein [Deltaproteobacteria bacterium]
MKKLLGTLLALLAMFAFIPGVWAEWKSITDPVQIFEEGYIQVVGVSEEGQSRYKAMRAATVVAQRDLLEIMEGLRLSGQTTVKDGMLQSDDIRTSITGFLRGAIKCGEKYHNDRRYAEVCMKLHIRGKGGLYDVILPLIKENKIQRVAPALPTDYYKPKLIPKVIGTEIVEETVQKRVPEIGGKPATVTETVAVVKQVPAVVFDGLIVDVRDFKFRPALVNTVVTAGDKVVFDPSKILSAILVERGCGGFTTDPGKAKALLESWGSKKPMIIKGVGVVKMTNAKVSPDDAAAIYLSDQKSNLLANAKVVFLLK